MKYMIQCKFEHGGGPELTQQYAWVDYDYKLKLGDVVSFKRDPRLWKVIEIGHIVQSLQEIESTWLVGGNQEITARKESA